MVDFIPNNPADNKRYTYGENWGSEDKEGDTANEDARKIEIAGALTFWTIMIFIGVILNIISPVLSHYGVPNVGLLDMISHYILYIPGAIIIALVVAAYIGEKVGSAASKVKEAFSLGLINAVYAAFIYAIIITILYLIIRYADPSILPNLVLNNFLVYMVGLPVTIVIVVVPLLAGLAAARHGAK